MNITTQQDTQAAANKAAEEGGLPTPRAIMDVVDEFGSGTTCYIAEDLRAAIASAIAADRASRQVANKAEVEPVAFMYQDDQDLVEPGTGSCLVSKARCNFYRNETPLYVAPPASTVLTDERTAALVEARDAVGEFRKNIDIFSESKQDAALAALDGALHAIDALIGEVAAQAGQVAVPGWISVDERVPGEQGQDSEEVLCFLSGHCAMTDFECRDGAGWGIRLGYYDADKGMFRTGGRPDASVTHWMPLPAAPSLAKESK